MEKVINTIFPPKCLFCGVTGSIFCEKCLEKCLLVEVDKCLICGEFSHLGVTHRRCYQKDMPVSIFSCYQYFGIVRTCIKRAKYGSRIFSAFNTLISEGINHAKVCGISYQDLIVIPIPLNRRKYRSRGFNQADLISKKLAKSFSLRCQNSILTRNKATTAQYKLNRYQRRENIKGAFFVKNIKYVENKKILLVDDICTSGATLLEASKVLYEAGAKRVHCFTLARKM